MEISSVLVYLKTSEGHKLALAPIGSQEIMWYELKNRKNIEEIVQIWRSRNLRTHARVPGLHKKQDNFMAPFHLLLSAGVGFFVSTPDMFGSKVGINLRG